MFIFIVGNSRSGTTLVGRILNLSNKIHTFKELHFFEKIYDFDNHYFSRESSRNIVARLIRAEKDHYFSKEKINQFYEQADDILKKIGGPPYHAMNLFSQTLLSIAKENNAQYPCEQTPRNVFLINQISEQLEESYFINMIRDPRDVLLSQKYKWKRRKLGASSVPISESIRSWINYHPVTISKLWNSSITAAANCSKNAKVMHLKYEDLLMNPEDNLRKMCAFLKIEYSDEFLRIDQRGSSTTPDLQISGFNTRNIGKWENGNLSNEELWICQRICKKMLLSNGYSLKKVRPNSVKLLILMILFPFKLGFSILLNIRRMNNIFRTIQRRL